MILKIEKPTIVEAAGTKPKKIEEFIMLSPEQWLMYYPVWPDQMSEDL